MQPIQDKDFDQLFKNAFEDAEITPSRDLWSSIESQMEPKKKRIFPIYWLAAAAVLLIASVGFLVYQQQNVETKQLANYVAPKKPTPLQEPVQKDTIKPIIMDEVEDPKGLLKASQPKGALAATKSLKPVKQPEEAQKVFKAIETQKESVVIAQVAEPKQDIRSKIEEAVLKTNSEVILASNPGNVVADEVVDNTNQNENKSIRNVGDVVNLIVNKMDKRKDKLIQFRTDDDDSSISSINIGPFKFGKKKK